MKFSNGDRVEAHIKSIDRWRPATVLTTYPGHGGHMVITDGGQRLHAKRGDLRAIGEGERTYASERTFSRGDQVEVRSSEGSFWAAGIFERWVDDTRQQALVRDGSPWPDTFTADPFHASNMRHKAPTPDPHDTAYQGEVGDHQPQHTDNGDGTGEVSIEIFPKLRTMFVGRDDLAYVATRGKEIRNHILNSDPNYGRDTKGTFTKPRLDSLDCIPNGMGPITTSTLKYGHVAKDDELSMRTPENTPAPFPGFEVYHALNAIRKLGTTTAETVAYLESIEAFVQMGMTPEVLNSYVAALGRFNAYGFTTQDLERITTESVRANYTVTPNQRDSKIPNIAHEYRGTR